MQCNAPAKLNLTLDVCGKRADGYHLLDSVMQSVSLCDTVTVERADRITVTCSDGALSGEGNIAFTAAARFLDAAGLSGGAKIEIEKHIPQGAGLGGGSADAAAVLRGLNRIYEVGFPKEKLCEIGLSVGADVPFCISGGTARAQGVGECLTQLPDLPECFFVLVKEGEKPSTAAMYRALDNGNPPHPDTAAAVRAIAENDLAAVCEAVGNSFAPLYRNDELYAAFAETNPLCVSLSGSGPTVFAIYPDRPAAENAAAYLRANGRNPLVAVPQKREIF